MRQVQNACGGPFLSNARISSTDKKPWLYTDRLWQEYFTDPFHWWDNRMNKTSPKAPDFRHKSTNQRLWIDCPYNPGWVKGMLEKNEAEKCGSQKVNRDDASGGLAKQEHGCLNSDDCQLEEKLACHGYLCKASFRSGVQSDASRLQQVREDSRWDALDWTEEPASLDKLICILQKSRRKKSLAYAKSVHVYICENGLEAHRAVGNHIVTMFVECGSVSDAQQAFNRLVHRNERSWTSLIIGYTECGQLQRALDLYQKMQEDSVHPSSYTLVAFLKACARLKDLETGRKIHSDIGKQGFGNDVFVGSTLVDMYVKCVSLAEAQEAFDNLQVRNVVSWNALIAGYAEHGPFQEALKSFEQMQLEGISPDGITIVCILKACGNIGAIQKGQEIHADMAQRGFERDVFIGSTLVDMYVKCGSLAEAQEAFDKLPVRNVVSWNALIAGYAEHGPGQEVLKCFEQMQREGVSPDSVTFICVLKACGNIGAIDKGREIHADIAAHKKFEGDVFLGSTLVDMYAKCGSPWEACEVFEKLPVRNIVSWNAMIKGYGMNYEGNMAVQCFEEMKEHGVKPDDITFTCLLTACSRAKLVLKGQEIFKVMKEAYGIMPTTYHYTCMVDLLAQSGHLYEAANLLETILCPTLWSALLNACKIYGEAELGLRCFQQLVQTNPECAAPYVLMAKIYASSGRWGDARRIEELRKHAGARKKPASALIEVNKNVHEFVVGNKQSKEITAMLGFLNLRMKEEGHVPDVNLVVRPISDEEKEAALCEHAEKLAIAFGLLNTPQGQTLRITKNLRMCNDCHSTSKIISRIERREIIIRDLYRVHHFRNGLCSCNDLC